MMLETYAWQEITPERQSRLLERPAQGIDASIRDRVGDILDQVRNSGDSAVRALTARIDGVDIAPANGWSADGVVEAIPGHTYVLRIRNASSASFGPDDNYAKIWLEGFEAGGALIWWAYQEVPGERQFGDTQIQLLAERQGRGRRPGATLLVCPMSVVGNWRREIQRFAPDLRVMVHHGGDRARGDEFVQAVAQAQADLAVAKANLAEARAAAALSSWPPRAKKRKAVRSPRRLWRSLADTAPSATWATWAPPPMTMTRLPKTCPSVGRASTTLTPGTEPAISVASISRYSSNGSAV